MASTSDCTIVLITGANQGIGYEVAKGLLAHKNYHILLGSRDAARGAKAAAELDPTGRFVEPITIDVTDDASIQQAVEQVASKHGRLDVLVNNAGINNEFQMHFQNIQNQKEGIQEKPDLSELRRLFRDVYEVNVSGAAITTEAFAPLLEKSAATPARIVFVSSHTGSLGLRTDQSSDWYQKLSNPSFPLYRSSKAALNMLTLHYAAKYQAKGWKVNASCPNLTATNFSRGNGRPASESAVNIVRLATLGADGESGVYTDENGIVPW
jgi:NAD(P)-dependent dehydrogenase (short-subunit alcohol dehydrogenase family)